MAPEAPPGEPKGRAPVGAPAGPLPQRGNFVWRDRAGRVRLDFDAGVFGASSAVVAAVVTASLVYLPEVGAVAQMLQGTIADRAGWFLILTVNVVLGYLLWLLVSPFGRVRLGGDGATPEFSRVAWLAMLFSAGMGIGLMFYAVAEPVQHLVAPPGSVEPRSVAAYETAIGTTFLHWGLHAWGVYALAGLALAHAAFNRGAPLALRSVLRPVLGRWTDRWPGRLADVTAAVATLFGVATSLGLGAMQVNQGLRHLASVPVAVGVQVGIIALITAVATISVLLGLDRGIKRLSMVNMIGAGALLLFVLLAGPTQFILDALVENVGLYMNGFFARALWTESYGGNGWQSGWTVFYWGWWIAWSPFVGLFIARISRGRTIREFIGGALFAATPITFLWLTVFGGSALLMELEAPGSLSAVVETNVAASLFEFLERLPVMGGATLPDAVIVAAGALAALVVVTFFVTSSDSASLVIDIITAGGRANPPAAQRVYWAILEGVVAAVLLLGGGLVALQSAAISAGLPFAIVLLLMIVGLQRALGAERRLAAQTGGTAARPGNLATSDL